MPTPNHKTDTDDCMARDNGPPLAIIGQKELIADWKGLRRILWARTRGGYPSSGEAKRPWPFASGYARRGWAVAGADPLGE